jgi:hypothetical protein
MPTLALVDQVLVVLPRTLSAIHSTSRLLA